MNKDPFSVRETKQQQHSNPIRILIVDDQRVIRAKIKEILSTHSQLEIVGMAKDGDHAIAQIITLSPDVVLMDIEMPKMNGIEVTKIIAEKFPETRILVLSTHEKEEYVQKIINAGADGYIRKQTPAIDFVAAIHAVHKGYSHFSPNILRKIQVVTNAPPAGKNLHKLRPKQSNPQDSCRIIEADSAAQGISATQETGITQGDQEESQLPQADVEEFLPPIEKWLTWGGLTVGFVLALLLPLSSVLQYKTKVKVPATLRPQGEVRLVQAQTAGSIFEVLLKPGDKVTQGDLIATIESSNLKTQQRQLEQAIAQQKLQSVQFNAQITSLENQIMAESKRNSSEIQAAEAQLASRTRTFDERTIEVDSQLLEAEANLEAIKSTLSAAENRVSRYQSAAEEGALSQEQLEEAQLEVKQQRQEIAAAQARFTIAQSALDPSNAEITMARQDIEQARKSGQANIASLNREKEAIVQQQIVVQQQLEKDIADLKQLTIEIEKTLILATASGEISGFGLRNPGQTVQAGQEIAQIIPDNVALEVRLLASPQDIGRLEVGQSMQMRISACPYPDYGVLEGQVSRIAGDISQQNEEAPAAYEVFVKPEANSFGRQEHQCLLQAGMEGTAEIITRQESVLKFIMRKARLISNV